MVTSQRQSAKVCCTKQIGGHIVVMMLTVQVVSFSKLQKHILVNRIMEKVLADAFLGPISVDDVKKVSQVNCLYIYTSRNIEQMSVMLSF